MKVIVIKLGGSLLTDTTTLKQCLQTIEQQFSEQVVVVPGGGVLADQVRLLQKQHKFDDKTAHHMALLTMQQMALLIQNMSSQELQKPFLLADSLALIKVALDEKSLVIWSPDSEQLNSFNVAASWQVTSDSLAAWLAMQLNATELILVKSVEIPLALDIHQMQQMGLLDEAFNQYCQNASYQITVVNKYSFNKHRFNEYTHS